MAKSRSSPVPMSSAMYPDLDGGAIHIPSCQVTSTVRYLATGYLAGTTHHVVLRGNTLTDVKARTSIALTADLSDAIQCAVQAAIAAEAFHPERDTDLPRCCDQGVARFIVDGAEPGSVLFADPADVPKLARLFLEVDASLANDPGGLHEPVWVPNPQPLPFPVDPLPFPPPVVESDDGNRPPSPPPTFTAPQQQQQQQQQPPPTFGSSNTTRYNLRPNRPTSAYGDRAVIAPAASGSKGKRLLNWGRALGSKLVRGNFILRQRFHEQNMSVSELLAVGHPLKQIREQLGLESVSVLYNEGLCVADMGPARWQELLDQFDLKRTDLSQYFALTTLGDFAHAGLAASQLEALGINANSLLVNRCLQKADLEAACKAGWRFLRAEWMHNDAWITCNDWARFGLDYDTLLGLHMQPGDYRQFLGVDASCVAVMLGLVQNTPATRARLDRVSLCVDADFLQ